jgi:hypothetical protein
MDLLDERNSAPAISEAAGRGGTVKKLIAVATLIALVNLLTGCATTGGTGDLFNPSGVPAVDVQAKDFPELKLVTTTGESFRGKLTLLQGDVVTLRPYPYWNIPDVRIPLDTIHQVELTGTKSHAGRDRKSVV